MNNLIDLEQVRALMMAELEEDIKTGRIYESKNLKILWVYIEVLRKNIYSWDIDSFSQDLSQYMKWDSVSKRLNNAIKLANSEFNRYYIRGVCLKAIELNITPSVYRYRTTKDPRPESVRLEGNKIDAYKPLQELRRKDYYEISSFCKVYSWLSIKL